MKKTVQSGKRSVRSKAEEAFPCNNEAWTKLSHFAVELAMLSSEDNVEEFIMRKIKEISGAEVAIFNEYNSENRTTTIRHIEMEHRFFDKVSKLLGTHIYGIHTEVNDEMYHEMTAELVGMRSSLYEMAMGAISRGVAASIQTLLKLDRFIGLAYVIEGQLYGTSVLAMRKDQPDLPKEILESLVSLVAVSLRRKKAEQELRESEEKYKTLFKIIPDIIYIIDRESGKIEEVNDQAIKHYGYSHSEFMGLRHIDVSYEPEKTSGAAKSLKKRIDIPVRYHKRKDGSVFPLEITASPFEIKGREKIIAVARDITERKMAEEALKVRNNELAKLNDELEKFTYANQELNQFAYTASHQLQEPIRTISNYIHVIEEDYASLLNNDVLNHFGTIEEAVKRMALLINSLFEYSQLGRNKKLAYVDCNQLIKSVIKDLDYMIESSGATIEVGEMPELYLYETEIHQLFQNLISNAIKFRSKDNKPKVQISSEKLNEKWMFSVSDNGIGIDPFHFNRIFNIFQRLHSSEEEYEGKGIGLAYCKKIVQLHFGEIWLDSVVGKGSTFKFTIPLIPR
ncbi:MAG: PAS domain S-box protein [Bacteroidales bacterium]|nr:PAS domain S-box protein [Bacteroidales bacterium]